jgi:N-acyl-D-amino-acid deacylase
MLPRFFLLVFLTSTIAVAARAQDFDVIIKGGAVYDGTGGEAQRVDLAIKGDRIAGLGDFKDAGAKTIVNASGLAVAPGFINMLSWSTESLIQDGRSQSEIRQGVTTEIMGEGESMGPMNDRVREFMLKQQADIKYDITWKTLTEYLQFLEKRGISCNVASFIGATTIRQNVIGFDDRPPTPQELDQMRELVRKEMEAGALGIGTSLIYPPAFYAKTDELIELCKVAAKYKGKYISHMRSEGNQLLEAFDELLRISRGAGIPAEVYHIKAAGQKNWAKSTTSFHGSSQRRRKGSTFARTSTPIPPAEPDSMPVSRHGPRTAVIQPSSNGCAIRPHAKESKAKSNSTATNGKICTSPPVRRIVSSSLASNRKN